MTTEPQSRLAFGSRGQSPLSNEEERAALTMCLLGYVTIYGFPYEVYANVFGMNDKGQIVGNTFDFSSGRIVGYVATLPK